jgi:hypothetical protein
MYVCKGVKTNIHDTYIHLHILYSYTKSHYLQFTRLGMGCPGSGVGRIGPASTTGSQHKMGSS